MVKNAHPFISIAIPTFSRIDLLKQTIQSILNQSFSDFEIIIGNDFVNEQLTFDKLELFDERIRIINNETNLGEGDNMNNLLHKAQGEYFTWQFDDDIYAPSFLETIYRSFKKNTSLQCIYTGIGFIYGTKYPAFSNEEKISEVDFVKSSDFIPKVLMNELNVAGCCGVFSRKSITEIGGIEKLSNTPIAIHSEFLLLINLYRFRNIGFIPDTLMYSRDYEGTFSGATRDYEIYRIAGMNLLKRGLSVHFRYCNGIEESNRFIIGILNTIISFYIMRAASVNGINLNVKIREFTNELFDRLRKFGNYISDEQLFEIEEMFMNKRWTKTRIKALLKWKSPKFINQIVKTYRARISSIGIG